MKQLQMDVSRHLDRDPTISPTKATIVLPTSTPSISPSISSQPSNIEFEFDGIREPDCGYYDFSVDVLQLI